MKKRRILSKHKLASSKDILYCAHEGKKNMWLYFEQASEILFMIDPISPSSEVIDFIENSPAKKKQIILTACQIEKKKNIPLWRVVFPDIGIITPDATFFQNEYLVAENTITTFDETSNLTFLSTIIGGNHRLCIHSAPYLFLGEFIHNVPIRKYDSSLGELVSKFFEKCIPNTICLHSFGPISLLEMINTLIVL